jgi:3-deoxy-7-phosphoheptulonate synthase
LGLNNELIERYSSFVEHLSRSLAYINNLDDLDGINNRTQGRFYTSHEALLLDYEIPMTRIDTTSGHLYNCGAHLLWIGDRTRFIESAHVEYASKIQNPVGIKVGPTSDVVELISIIDKINPMNEKGKIVLIPRLGLKHVESKLRNLIESIEKRKLKVAWVLDPMHGNTYNTSEGIKTRSAEDILAETKYFFDMHRKLGTVAGGVHLEISGDNVTECVGGVKGVTNEELLLNYQSNCDPRLNADQALEFAFRIREII